MQVVFHAKPVTHHTAVSHFTALAIAPHKTKKTGDSAQSDMAPRKTRQKAKQSEEDRPKGSKRVTELTVATRLGLVPRAQRPFAVFCKTTRQRLQDASKAWKLLTAEQKDEYKEKSSDSFVKQRQRSQSVGLALRKRQRNGLAEDTHETASASSFGSFCSQTGKDFKSASDAWKKMSKEEKMQFHAASKAPVKESDESNSDSRSPQGFHFF